MKDFSSLIVTKKTNIREAVPIIESAIAQIPLVDNEDEKLLGTLSEGNMSRDLAKGCDLKSPVVKLMNRELCSLFEDVFCP